MTVKKWRFRGCPTPCLHRNIGAIAILRGRKISEDFNFLLPPRLLGREEFVAILPDTNAAQARVTAIKLVEFIAQLHFETVGSITVSCGVAEFNIGDALATALKRADEALFRAKAAGRNRAAFAKTFL